MSNKIKAIVKMKHTERDQNGNVYWTATIINTTNSKMFTTDAVHYSNIISILQKAGLDWNNIFKVHVSTGSKRHSSLPCSGIHLEECHFSQQWKTALQKIGFRNLNKVEER